MNQKNREIRWGIIGCGDVTEVKSGPALQMAKNSSLVAVMRRNADLARDYALRHHVPKWYDCAEQLINDDEVNAVYIATPPVFHKEYTLNVAQTKKPVYVEKPMAMNYSECREMLSACSKNKVPLFVAYYRRALPKFLKIKEIIEDGILGDIRSVNVQLYRPPLPQDYQSRGDLWWRTTPHISGGGYFVDMASHMIDLLHFFFGQATEVSGNFSNQANLYSTEDTVSAEFVFKNRIQGTGNWCFTAGVNLDQTRIIGSRGMLSYDTFGSGPIILQWKDQTKELLYGNPEHIQEPLIQTVVNELLGEGSCSSKGESAALANWFMDRILGKS